MSGEYRFSFGPWNLHEGADPFGPPVRASLEFARKLRMYRQLGFHAVQFHDDDAVPNIDEKSIDEIRKQAADVKRMLAGEGLLAEFVAPRLWESPKGIDGGFTSNDPECRRWAVSRLKRSADIADELGTKLIVLWLAREGTYIRESKNAIDAQKHLLDAINQALEYNPRIEIAIEPKPNEPMDHAYLPTVGHALALASQTTDPKRVGGLIETAHAILAGLDPSDEMAFALSMGKLWSVHLNDQNGLKFDQDKTFGAANLRSASTRSVCWNWATTQPRAASWGWTSRRCAPRRPKWPIAISATAAPSFCACCRRFAPSPGRSNSSALPTATTRPWKWPCSNTC